MASLFNPLFYVGMDRAESNHNYYQLHALASALVVARRLHRQETEGRRGGRHSGDGHLPLALLLRQS